MKERRYLLPALLAALLMTLNACVPLPPATDQPAAEATAPAFDAGTPAAGGQTEPGGQAAPADPLSRCPAATDVLQRLVVPEGLYCLAYPAEYKVEKPGAGETILLIGGLLDASNPRVHIRVTGAGGATVDAAADRVAAEFEGFELERSTRTVAGEPAVVLDKAPGQDINRRVLFVRDGMLYDLMFSPADPAQGDVFGRMEALQEQVLSSFTFLPAGIGMADDCLTPIGGTQLHKDLSRGYCLLYPAGYSVQQNGANDAVFYSGSLLDISKPKLFVRVEDANGKSAKEIADEAAAEVQASVPGQQVDRPFGVTIGYEVAERLDNMPGQDMARVIIAVHGPRAYRFTFVPADPADPAMFEQAEALYDLVLRSFRFTN